MIEVEQIIAPQHWQVELVGTQVVENVVVFEAYFTTKVRNCPDCGFSSSRIHSRYQRQLAVLPLAGQVVRLTLRVRRFFCDNLTCQRRTFAEQSPELVASRARRTLRQYLLLQDLAFALGGRPGARVAHKQGIAVSRHTLVRLIRKTPLPLSSTPRILGVDDWAYRKGVAYGTLLVDLEKHCPVDLLPDCTVQSPHHPQLF